VASDAPSTTVAFCYDLGPAAPARFGGHG
jgi:hypothetical protein